MRVIAGSAGGIPLSVPSRVARPTMDKVRAAIFSSLADAVPGSRVLDLFSGSGALGIEALSRGAQSCVFVEKDHAAAAVIRRNLARTSLSGSVQNMDVFRFLPLYAHPDSFDLIFADPPYAKADGDRPFCSELLSDPAVHSSLAPFGTLILETLADQTLPDFDESPWKLLRNKSYGESAILFLVRR